MSKHLAGFFAGVAGLLLCGTTAHAGDLILQNQSEDKTFVCNVDGSQSVSIAPDKEVRVTPSAGKTINWVVCNPKSGPAVNLTTRSMNISADGPNGLLVFTGNQKRVLNVALYPYLPNPPNVNFDGLVRMVVHTYQRNAPDVLLSVQMNQGTDIYSFDNLQKLLGADGLDVIELDTLYMGYLAAHGLINPATIVGAQPLPVAVQASTVEGKLWGVPSWLCMDFVYSLDSRVHDVTNLGALLKFLKNSPANIPPMAADYDGSWRLPSIYINSYVQTYGYEAIAKAQQMPPDELAIAELVALTDTCAVNSTNNCTNGTYHNSTVPGVTEKDFAQGKANAVLDFSEQSFYIKTYGMTKPLYVVPGAWGMQIQPLLFSDSFVTSKATCAVNSACSRDATSFIAMMTDPGMKLNIVNAVDLAGTPPKRTLLVATASFYDLPEIKSDPLYQQYSQVFVTAKPFPNNFTPELQNTMKTSICAALKEKRPAYACK